MVIQIYVSYKLCTKIQDKQPKKPINNLNLSINKLLHLYLRKNS